MNAMVLDGIAPIESSPLVWREVDDPRPSAGEVRVRVGCCALCRTDLHVIEGDLPRAKLPIIPGHQVVGRVDELGDGCTTLRVGDRVGIAWLRSTDGTCLYCQRGRENLCDAARFTGYHADGGYAEHAVVREDFAYRIPEAFDDAHAAPLLCAGLIGYRALERANAPFDAAQGGRLLLIGFGSSAHVVIQLAVHRGHEVIVQTRGENHQRLARQMGAAWAGADARDCDMPADSAILFAPSGKLVPPAMEALRKGGTLAIAGIHLSPIPEMDYARHVFEERDLRSVTANTREDARRLLAEAADAGVRPHVTTFPMPDANAALQQVKRSEITGTGVLVL